jgi:hypothetical protein
MVRVLQSADQREQIVVAGAETRIQYLLIRIEVLILHRLNQVSLEK